MEQQNVKYVLIVACGCCSLGLGAERQCTRCLPHRRGAAGSRATGAPLRAQEDQAGRHEQTVTTGNRTY